MEYVWDAPFADVFICNGEPDWHDYYYISLHPTEIDSLTYRINRTGIESRTPDIFHVERSAATPYCQIFCILSGKGQVTYQGKHYALHKNQLVILSSKEAHSYESSPDDPFGLVWMEFYGADAQRLVRHIIEHQTPVIEGPVVARICALLGAMQQRIMLNENYDPSLEIYQILLELLHNEAPLFQAEHGQENRLWQAALDAYIDAHLTGEITNSQLAGVCGLSPSYLCKQLKLFFRLTPQEYVMNRRITKAKYILTQTAIPVERVAEQLGFCNASHFIRRFKAREGMTPARYRRLFSVV